MSSAVAAKLDAVKEHAGVRSRDIAQLLNTTPQTVSRWQTGKVAPQPDHLHKLLALEWLASQLAEFYEPDEARLWLFAPHRQLGGARPADRIAEGRIDEVLAIIDRLRDGAYV